jgi:hypothetical protein
MGETREQYPAEGLRRLQVRLPRGDVRFERVDGDAVLIEADKAIVVERSDDTLAIRPGKRSEDPRHRRHRHEFKHEPSTLGVYINEVVSEAVESVFSAGFPFSLEHGADVRVGVPTVLERPLIEAHTGAGGIDVEGLTAEFVLRSDRGDITVRGAGGALQLNTGAGDVEIQAFGGPLRVHTGVGEVELADCANGGTVHTGSGDVEAHGLSGAWDLRSGAGDVEITARDEATLVIGTGSGDVEVEGGALHRLEVQTGSGDVTCRSLLLGPRHRITTGQGDLEVAIANPPGARLMINTTHGDVKSAYPLVRVGKQGPQSLGGARFVGNIGDSTIDVELRTGSGDIEITRLDLDEAGLRLASQARNAATSHRGRDMDQSRADQEQAAWAQEQEQAARDQEQAARDMEQARRDAGWASGAIPTPTTPPAAPAPPVPPVAPVPFAPTEPVFKGEEPVQEAKPEAAPPPAGAQPTPAPAGNPRLAVLESLGRGEISVEEAAKLLESLR